MGRNNTRYLESPATEEEDSYNYRVEWDKHETSDYDFSERKLNVTDFGSGSEDISGFDNAWDMFNDLRDSPDYHGIRLIRISSDGTEVEYSRA